MENIKLKTVKKITSTYTDRVMMTKENTEIEYLLYSTFSKGYSWKWYKKAANGQNWSHNPLKCQIYLKDLLNIQRFELWKK